MLSSMKRIRAGALNVEIGNQTTDRMKRRKMEGMNAQRELMRKKGNEEEKE